MEIGSTPRKTVLIEGEAYPDLVRRHACPGFPGGEHLITVTEKETRSLHSDTGSPNASARMAVCASGTDVDYSTSQEDWDDSSSYDRPAPARSIHHVTPDDVNSVYEAKRPAMPHTGEVSSSLTGI